MKVIRGLDGISEFERAVITIGSFDGLHLGHQKIFKRLRSISNQIDGVSVVITFDPHPRQIIYPKDNSLRLINTVDEKIELLSKLDVDYLLLMPFTIEFSQIHPKEYVEKFLIKSIKPAYIVVGYDHHFGLNRGGDFNMLRSYEDQGFFKLAKIDKQEMEEMAISSTKIRNAILEGDIAAANGLLGYEFYLTGIVEEGNQLGREIGYPTANLNLQSNIKILPKDGIYAAKVKVNNVWHNSMLYIGEKPTLEEQTQARKVIEVHIFDFDQNIYEKKIEVHLLKFIHEDQKFETLNLLKKSIQEDEREIRTFFNSELNTNYAAKVGIAILNYNGYDFLESFLPYMLDSYSNKLDIVVIDNKSEDDSIDLLEQWFPEVNVIKLEENFGFAKGYNLGILELENEYIVLLNSDVKVSPGWLDPIIEQMERDQQIAAVQPKILSLEKETHFEYAGAAGGFMDVLGYPFCRGRIFDEVEADEGQYDSLKEVFWTSGAAMVVRKKVWDNLGGFDDTFFAHMEEIDFCWRVKRAGYKLIYLPDSAVYHVGGGTLAYDSPRKTYLNFRNNLSTILKNEKGIKLLWMFPLRLLLDGVAGLKFFLSGNFQSGLQIIKAHFNVYANIFTIMSTRKKDKKLIKKYSVGKPNEVGRFKKSILVSHFIKGITKFSDLKF